MDTNSVLILLSALIVFSYLFDMLARKTNIPSVLLLLFSGMFIRYIGERLGINPLYFDNILPVLGTVGLILIVLEGALDLKYSREKSGLILKALGAALFILLITSLSIALFFHFYTEADFRLCLLNAIPFSVISSAVAIPSVRGLMGTKKEFIIYESSFSDILGIVLFNFVNVNTEIQWMSFVHLGGDMVLVILFALVICFGLVFLMGRIKYHVKFFLVLAVLILMYGVGKIFHLPSLLIVLALGLLIANIESVTERIQSALKTNKLEKIFLYRNFHSDIHQFSSLAAESAFLIRTFFFLVFGYSLQPAVLMESTIWITGSITILLIYVVRMIYLRFVVRAHLWPEVLVSPRGLISVLLFISIAPEQRIFGENNGLLLFLILFSGLIMTVGLLLSGKKLPAEEIASD